MKKRTFGAEIEKPVSDTKTSLPHKTSQAFFMYLQKKAKKRKTFTSFHKSDLKPEVVLGVLSKDLGEQGMDNGFNLLETALPYDYKLSELFQKMKADLKLTLEGLKKEGASVINLSIHPLAANDLKSYKKFVMPKGLYKYLRFRGLHHEVGIDAKAQNSPATGVTPSEAADACSVIIGIGAASIALFGNSPYANGKRSLVKETRLSMWHDMFKDSKVKGDDRVWRFPPKRFKTMAEYFSWMFADDTSIYFVLPESGKDYKTIIESAIVIPKHPSVLQFLSKPSWKGQLMKHVVRGNKETPLTIKPKISDMELMQFDQFTGARIRFGLSQNGISPEEFVQACKKTDKQEVEKLFEKHATFVYIEGRDAGANFPDRELMDKGDDIALSTLIGPSALQAGLIQNLTEATRLIASYRWEDLGGLRDAAIKDGLEGEYNGHSVYDFTKRVVETASNGLSKNDQRLLGYIEYVLKTRKNGADRAIEFVENQKGPLRNRIKKLIKSRESCPQALNPI